MTNKSTKNSRKTFKPRNRRKTGQARSSTQLPALDSLHNTRALASHILYSVVEHNKSLTALLTKLPATLADKDAALLQELVYGTCRWYFHLSKVHQSYLERPLNKEDVLVECLLNLGAYQLFHTRIPPHAAIHETVAAADELGISRFKALINAVLRQLSRDELATQTQEALIASYPQWMQEKIKHNWPVNWQDILAQGNQKPPMTLRVNPLFAKQDNAREHYLSQLRDQEIAASACEFAPYGIQLAQPLPVSALPDFSRGSVSVQDEAAQLSCELMQLAPGLKVLDACAAPGGKSCAMLESEPGIELTALDSDARRAKLIEDNLGRLSLKAQIKVAEAEVLEQWWDGESFDRILLDAPCSASAVIRRHPDIKLLRKEGDIKALAELQLKLLKSLWQTLKPGGRLVYATCSVFPQENSRIIERFLKQEASAQQVTIDARWGQDTGFGRQLFPQQHAHDGFFYACLRKQ